MFNSQIRLGKEYLTPEYFPPETAPLSLPHNSKAGIEVVSKSMFSDPQSLHPFHNNKHLQGGTSFLLHSWTDMS